MASLPEPQRKLLEKAVLAARDAAEAGARDALERLAVPKPRPFAEMSASEQELRVALRAHARQLGDPLRADGAQAIDRLVGECAYEHWHRMLFARFLAENQLLIHPEHGVAVTLDECEQLAPEEGEPNRWALAARFAARMLPALFRPDDPILSLHFAPEHQQALEACLADLAPDVFRADDSLGWVYQFWQKKRKDEVNDSGVKIGADELPAVTQLFTEPYMVQFLLHNTLGAWWAGKVLAGKPELSVTATSEEELRRACAVEGVEWTYLRFVRDGEGQAWRPAAGTFDGWPKRAAELRVLDPCCGSGHFLVEAFRILVALRRAEERLVPREAGDAVLRDNLFGLELDERCIQIAAFSLALAAWNQPEARGFRVLPELHLACSGLSVGTDEADWLRVAGAAPRLRDLMRRLHRLFTDAPVLGSLLDPKTAVEGTGTGLRFDDERTVGELLPLIEQALAREEVRGRAESREIGIAAQGMARAAALLAGTYTLVITNVPYLGRGAHVEVLKEWADKYEKEAQADLATIFVARMLRWASTGGSIAAVTPQNWLYLTGYKSLRERLLTDRAWNLVGWLGAGAFETISGEVVSVALVLLSTARPLPGHSVAGVDVSGAKASIQKAALLRGAHAGELESFSGGGGFRAACSIQLVPQVAQLKNPDARVLLRPLSGKAQLSSLAHSSHGIGTFDSQRFCRNWWEVDVDPDVWMLQQSTPDKTVAFSGCSFVVLWEGGNGQLATLMAHKGAEGYSSGKWKAGLSEVGKRGVLVGQMGDMPSTLFAGSAFDENASVIVPDRPEHLPAIWCFCSSQAFVESIRAIDDSIKVTCKTLVKLPFDLEAWTEVARERFPEGLPEPQSNDPTQWLFHGHVAGMLSVGSASSGLCVPDPVPGRHASLASRTPNLADALQVGVARLLGYRWLAERDPAMRLDIAARAWAERCSELATLADEDGVVCIGSVLGELPAADRLQRLLAAALGSAWSPVLLDRLLAEVEFGGKTLEAWLRDGFFEQHCKLFHERPFVWQIWDGRKKDGFSVLVNYHRLDRKLLERLTYTVLGDWITQQQAGMKAGTVGAADRLAAATILKGKLEAILEGEPPHDIFVRWKPLEEQPLGWDPDLNDGVRTNIRPFVEAGVLRKNPKIKWSKDRGKEPQSLRPADSFPWFWQDGKFTGDRLNDIHLTLDQKRAARRAKGRPC